MRGAKFSDHFFAFFRLSRTDGISEQAANADLSRSVDKQPPLERGQLVFGYVAIGLCQGIFALFTMYLPPLFPTLLRTTGAGFCYNIGRYAAAAGPLVFGALIQHVFTGLEAPLPYRYAGLTMCSIFLLGMMVLPFAPETRGKPLPE